MNIMVPKQTVFAVALAGMLMPVSAPGQTEEGGGLREDQEARARHRYIQRMDERGEIAPNALVTAKKELDAKVAMQHADGRRETAGISSWEWLGPGNIGGRIRSILIHPTNPNTMWIGGVAGGIWQTDNAGASWYPLNDFMANLCVTTLVLDPTNPLIMYAGTGENSNNRPASSFLPGAGVFKSMDGGITWVQLPSTSGWQYVGRLAHHPSSSGTLLAATGLGIFSTSDGGTNWIYRGGQGTMLDIEYSPQNPNRCLAGSASTAFVSGDAGANWTPVNIDGSNTNRCELAFAPSDQNIAYASVNLNGGQLYRSTDGGNTWNQRNNGTNYLSSGNYANCIWVDPTNPANVVVGGLDLYRSTDAGLTLTKISRWQNFHNGGPANSAHADHHWIVHHPGYNGTSNRTVYFANDGGIQRASDVLTVAETSGWTNLANNLGITQFYGGAAAPDGSLIVGGAQDNDKLHYRSTSGPQAWFQPGTGDGGFAAVNQGNPNRIYGEYIYLNIQRSENGGNTYAAKASGLQDAGNAGFALFIAPFSMDPNNPTILVAGGRRIWRTVNSADDWGRIRDSVGSQSCSAIDIAKGNSSVIWVGYELGVVSYTTNAGVTWTNVDGPLPDRYITDIAINPINSDEVFVTIGGYTSDQVWLTTNRGVTWSRRTGTSYPFDLPSVQVNTVRYHPGNPNWIYVGTDLGVFASEDKGVRWRVLAAYPGNDGPANVPVDELFWQGGEYLIAATHGRGMYRAHLGVYVALDTPIPPGFGTQQYPYTLVQLGINAMGDGVPLIFAPSEYLQGPLTFDRRGWLVAPDGGVVIR